MDHARRLDLKASHRFEVDPALSALLDVVGPSPEGDSPGAKQSAIGSYSPLGFEAAALVGMRLEASGISRRAQKGLLRRATPTWTIPMLRAPWPGVKPTSQELELVMPTGSV